MESRGEAKSMRWEQTAKLASQLISDGKEIATLNWAKRWGTLATGEAGARKWTFKRVGFLRPRVTIREAGSASDLAILSMSWAGDGGVVFSDGETFQLRRLRFWHPEWTVTSDSRGGKMLLELRPEVEWGKEEGCEVKVEGGAEGDGGRTILLAILAWYIILLIADYDYGSGATTVMAASGF